MKPLSLKKKLLLLAIILVAHRGFCQQDTTAYIPLFEYSGYNTAPFTSELTAAAAQLRLTMPDSFRQDFKVYSCGIYTLQYAFATYPPDSAYAQIKRMVESQSKYYLLFVRQSDSRGLFMRYWLDMKLPNTGQMKCLVDDQLEVVNESIYNLMEESFQREMPHTFFKAEKEVMGLLGSLIFKSVDCCNPNKGEEESCVLVACHPVFKKIWYSMGYNNQLAPSTKNFRTKEGIPIVANKNNTDNDEYIDADDPVVESSTLTRDKEIDLIKIELGKSNDNVDLSSSKPIIIRTNNPYVRFYKDAKKSNASRAMLSTASDNNGQTWYSFEVPIAEVTNNQAYYIEVVEPSALAQDIDIQCVQEGKYSFKVTAFWVNKKTIWYKESDNTRPGAQGTDLEFLPATSALGSAYTQSLISENGQLYGFGPFFSGNYLYANNQHPLAPILSGKNKQIGGRILFSYEVVPNDPASLALVQLDCTRRRQNKLYRFSDNQDNLIFIDNPDKSATPNVNPEFPNDDNTYLDETSEFPNNTNGFFYSSDVPASQIIDTQEPNRSFKVDVMNFEEYVRVRPYKFIPEDPDKHYMQNELVGSICSSKIPWHNVLYLKRNDEMGRWAADNTTSSLSYPRKSDGFVGNGTIELTNVTNSGNGSYSATYNKTQNSWTVKKVGTTQEVTLTYTASTKIWLGSFDGMSIKIREGNTLFGDASNYHWSKFTSPSKKNEIDLGTITNSPF